MHVFAVSVARRLGLVFLFLTLFLTRFLFLRLSTLSDNLVSGDTLSVTLVECSRLRSSGFPPEARLFATISLDPVRWTELLTSIHIQIQKNNSPRVGISFK